MTYDAPMPSSPPAGRLHGSFAGCQIIQPIGGGGMAVVYEARDIATDARLALKLVLRQAGQDAAVVLQAEREGAILQERLAEADPRVARIYRYGEEGDYFFVQMELVEGHDLSHLLERGPVPAFEAVRIAIEVGEVLRSAHSLTGRFDGREFRGVVHGDIKPRNIRLTPDGRVKVLDFGIAKALSLSRRLTRNEFGSLHYASPERLESGTVDERSDLWSLGVVLYEMVGGRLPFRAETEERLERAIRDRRPAPPLVCAPSLKRVVEKALAPRLEHRYGDAASVLADLTAFVEGRTTSADAAAEDVPTKRVTPFPGGTSAPGDVEPACRTGEGEAAVEPFDGGASRRSSGSGDAAAEPAGPGEDDATRRTPTESQGVDPADPGDEAAGRMLARGATALGPALRAVGPAEPGDHEAIRWTPTEGRGVEPGDSGDHDGTRRTPGPGEAAVPAGPGDHDATRRTSAGARTPADDATRRTSTAAPPVVDDATRRTSAATNEQAPRTVEEATGGTNAAAEAHATRTSGAPASTPSPHAQADPRKSRRRTILRAVLLAAAAVFLWSAFAIFGQWRILGSSRSLAADLAAARIAREDAFQEHKKLAGRAWTSLLVQPLRRELLASYLSVGDAVIEEYRSSDSPLVRERDWRRAGAAIASAQDLDPRDRKLRARRELIEGHLLRIDLRGRRSDPARAQEAIRRFRKAAEIDWVDPYLGLAALHAYVQHDVEQTDAAVEKIAEQGLEPGRRERAERADARLLSAGDLWADRASIARLPEESQYLEKIRARLSEAIELYGTVLGFENTHANLRKARRLIERVDERLAALKVERRRREGPLRWLFPFTSDDDEPSSGPRDDHRVPGREASRIRGGGDDRRSPGEAGFGRNVTYTGHKGGSEPASRGA